MKREEPPVLGLDCEGLVRGKPIALLQVSFEDHSYVIDMMKVNPFNHNIEFNLKQVLTSPKIVKVFHDFAEDNTALISNHGVYCNGVFDTQVAHRVMTKVSDIFGS